LCLQKRAIIWSDITRSKSFEKSGKTDIGRKLESEMLFGDFKTGVIIAAFQQLGKLEDKILLLISFVMSTAIH